MYKEKKSDESVKGNALQLISYATNYTLSVDTDDNVNDKSADDDDEQKNGEDNNNNGATTLKLLLDYVFYGKHMYDGRIENVTLLRMAYKYLLLAVLQPTLYYIYAIEYLRLADVLC
uniref:Uncharacterized protein n=1 Tax=Glossina brevipalpis TaxID=37001 RepID=A0A1A9WVT3_9MUSC